MKNWCWLQNITGLTYSPDDNLWIVDGGCSNLTQLDNVTFTLGEHRFLLRPDQYVLQVQLPRPVLLRSPSSHTVERLWVARHAGLRPCSLPCQTPLAVLGLGPMTCGPSQQVLSEPAQSAADSLQVFLCRARPVRGEVSGIAAHVGDS